MTSLASRRGGAISGTPASSFHKFPVGRSQSTGDEDEGSERQTLE